MNIQTVLHQLEQVGSRVKKSGLRQWSAQCPAHKDRSPSLGIGVGDDGRILLLCHAGCTFSDIVNALHLKEEDMFPDDTPPARREPIIWELRSLDNKLVASHYRIDLGGDKKQCWWESGGKKGLGGIRTSELPLYRSQDIQTFDKDRYVFVLEGEKACDAVRALGAQALSTVTGAHNRPSKRVLSSLSGLKVVLCPDHDRVGYQHMRAVGEQLKGLALEVHYLLFSNPTKEGYDAFDWAEAAQKRGSTKEQLRETLEGKELFCAELPTWIEAPTEEAATSKANEEPNLDNFAPLFTSLYTVNDLDQARKRDLLSLADLPRAEDGEGKPAYGWGARFNEIIGGGVGPGDLIAIGAASAGAGKTAFLLGQLLDGLALRSSFLAERDSQEPLTPVLLLSEMSPHKITERRLAWLTGEKVATWRAGKTAERRYSRPMVDGLYEHARKLLSGGTLSRLGAWCRQAAREALFSEGKHMLSTLRAVMNSWKSQLEDRHQREVWPIISIDPIQRFLRQDKTEVEAQNEFVRALDAIVDEECWICFITSDTNKGSAKGEAQGDAGEIGAALLRGSYALVHGADIACFLSKPEGPHAHSQTVELTFFKNRFGPSFETVLYHWNKITGRFHEFSFEEAAEKQSQEEKSVPKTKEKIKTIKAKEPVKPPITYPEDDDFALNPSSKPIDFSDIDL